MGIAEEMLGDDWSPMDAVADESPARFGELTTALAGKRATLAQELDKGVTPDAFTKGTALLAAYDAALKGLEKAREKCLGLR